ncbi:MAG: hypothetical protein IAE84_06140 [Saprospiraceae bacterium]|nr:hypothetical protein [Saprospiraceae bacterium]
MMLKIKLLLLLSMVALSACIDRGKDIADKNLSAPFPPIDHYYLTGQQPFSGEDLVSRGRITGFHKATGLVHSYTLVYDIIKRSYSLTHYGTAEDGKYLKRPIDFILADSILTNINEAFVHGTIKRGATYLDTPHSDYLSLTIEVSIGEAEPMSAEYFFYDFDDLPNEAKYFARQYLTDSLWIPAQLRR